ncbi:hypothetical protein GCM10009854_10950 [Saccharopolyspora halophila]|uniref:DUF6779 domain-containing protein n=1 Tax=Saccharopolyspora halophila TaxID=405551 RepID=A0ABN3FSU6_9PSEU
MSDPGNAETESTWGRSTALWGGALVLAAAATVVLVLSDDARLLRLGLVAALWSALIGAFAVSRLRDRVNEGERAAADRQRIYELELQREVAARREFEAQAQAEARRQAREESAAEIRSLQDELARLRSTLEQVVGGDVLFERVALRAESTRVRSLGEQGEGSIVQQAPNLQSAARPNIAQQLQNRQSSAQPPGAQQSTQQVSVQQATQRTSAPQPTQQQAAPPQGVEQQAGTQQTPAPQPPGRPITAKPKPSPVKPDVRPAKPNSPAAQPTAPEAEPVAQAARAAKTDATQQTEVISQISGQVPLEDPPTRQRPRVKQQASPTRPTPARPERPARRAEPPKPEPVEEDSGAHAAGTSVNDLLAAYGTSGNATQRKRRRHS